MTCTRPWSGRWTARPAAFAEWLAENPSVALADFASVAGAADVVVNATNGSATLAALTEAGAENLAGKVLLDVSNPLDFSQGFPPTLTVKDTDSLGEQVQRAFPEARVVKSLNTMNATLMVNPGMLPEPTTVFLSGRRPDGQGDGRASCSASSAGPTSSTSATSPPPGARRCGCPCGFGSWEPSAARGSTCGSCADAHPAPPDTVRTAAQRRVAMRSALSRPAAIPRRS